MSVERYEIAQTVDGYVGVVRSRNAHYATIAIESSVIGDRVIVVGNDEYEIIETINIDHRTQDDL